MSDMCIPLHATTRVEQQSCLFGVGYSMSSVTTNIWNRESIARLVTAWGNDTLVPALGTSKQPESRISRPVSEMPAAVMAAVGVIMQDTFKLLQVGPRVPAVPTVPAVEPSCCSRLKATRKGQNEEF